MNARETGNNERWRITMLAKCTIEMVEMMIVEMIKIYCIAAFVAELSLSFIKQRSDNFGPPIST